MAGRSLRQAPGDIPAEGVYGKAENSLTITGRLSFTVLAFNFAGPDHSMLSMRSRTAKSWQNAVAGYHHLGTGYRGARAMCSLLQRDSIALAFAAPLPSAEQNAASGVQHQHGREYPPSAFDGTKNAKLTAFDADVGGEPAIELATGRQWCASDCCSALGSLLRCVDGNDHISGERAGRSRATDFDQKQKRVMCARPSREDTGERNTQIIGPRERGAAATGASVAAGAATHYPERPSRASI